MAKPKVSPVRPKFPKELRFEIHRRIEANPEISSRLLHDGIVRKDARNIIFLWKKPVRLTMTLDDMLTVYMAPNAKEADRLLKKLIRDRSGEYEFSPSVITNTKTWLNKNFASKEGKPGEAVYGASGLGYVLEKHMTPNRAVRWLYPRIAQQRHENIAANTCVNIIEQHADSPERRNVAKYLRAQASGGMQYKRLKVIHDGLKHHYLHKRT